VSLKAESIGSNHTYTAIESTTYEYEGGCLHPDTSLGKLHEDYTGCEFIEKMIADVSKLTGVSL
jgi:hypothetical protein